MRLIDADDLPTLATELRLKNGKTKHFVGVEFDDIRNAPTIEAVPVRRGEWEDKSLCDGDAIEEWQEARCSACGRYHTTPYLYYFDEFRYCPNCGARMDKEADDEMEAEE